MNKRKAVGLVAMLALLLAGCTYHNLVVIEHDFDASVKALQAAEMNEFSAGNIDAATHRTLEQAILTIAQGGQQVATLLQQNASKQSIAAQVTNVSAALQALLNQGVLGIKNNTTKTNLTIIIQSLQAIVSNFQTALGVA